MKNPLILLLFLPIMGFGQSFQTVLNSTDNNNIGITARNIGVSNTMGAIGSDFSVLHATNPAGLASFKSKDFTFSINNNTRVTQSDFAGNVTSQSENDVNFQQLGYVHTSRRGRNRIIFGISFAQLRSFDREFSFEGRSLGSITDRFLEFSQGVQPDDLYLFEEGIAFDAGAIYLEDENGTSYISDFLEGDVVNKGERVQESGGLSELSLALGFDYSDKIKFGINLGIPILNYTIQRNYFENDPGNTIPIFNALNYGYTESLSGAGVNLKLGFHYKVTPKTTVGLGFQTPTAMSITQNWSASITYDYTEFDGDPEREERIVNDLETETASSEFSLINPLKVDLSASHVFGGNGFIAGGVELVNFNGARFSFEEEGTDFETDLNNQNNEFLRPVVVGRLGGEYVINKMRLRLGGQVSTSPEEGDDELVSSISTGVGFSTYGFYADLGYRYDLTNREYAPYLTDNSPNPIVQNRITNNLLVLTVGFRF